MPIQLAKQLLRRPRIEALRLDISSENIDGRVGRYLFLLYHIAGKDWI
jgi:hypothetical protein